ncbi:hypothetical protein [Pseudomonas fluorescens]|uniref:Uncharacterized protein n=1 Tax=Pseudomonas fluorescens TaxID=294 RepID=A0A5E7CTK9_PSEFL|nr:hypothetical protein [Pseudomonas fluorescens]VVO08490.1 hypothetical protein PS710_03251 [Pseudomonas fluorescens]
MLLKIQNDEALDSYISRNRLFLRDKLEVEDPFKLLQGDEWSIKELILIAEQMNWHCFTGFIKLIQLHTVYFRYHLVIDDVESMLLRHKYLEKSECGFGYATKRKDIAICLECIKTDIDRLGYSYWRRSHQDDIKVCAIHNLKLVTRCQFCNLAFRATNHCFYVLWSGCKCGRYILEAEIDLNNCRLELKRSRLYLDILSYNRKVECVAAYESFLSALNCNGRDKKIFNEVIEFRYERALFPWAKFGLVEEVKLQLQLGPEHLRISFHLVTALIFLLFTNFEEFIEYFALTLQKKSLQFESATEERAIIDS